MKITYLKLKNFINIYAGMKKKEIEIDFSKSENRLIVLVGKNGSGKTSILSELHPFASCGNMDVRSDVCLIMENHDGYKEIHIQDNDDLYIIKHNYLFKNKTKSVKSFISKNGVELNPNGNVKSFKEAVLDNLGLDQDLLKLMRLGSNVTSLVNMKSTSRKSFATKLFSDIDVYGGFYKKVSEEYRNIRAVMKSISSKLAKYNVSDEGEFENQLSLAMCRLNAYDNEKERLMKEIATLEAELKSIDISDENIISERCNYLSSKLSEAESMLDLVRNINMTKSEYELMKEKEKNEIKSEINNFSSSINTKISERDIYYLRKQELEESLKSAVSNVRINKLIESISEHETQITSLENKLKNRVRYDKYELLRLKEHVDKTTEMVRSLTHYTQTDIKKIVNSILDSKDIKQVIEITRSKMTDEYEMLNAEILNIQNINIELQGYSIPEGSCKDSNCPYKNFYYKMTNKTDSLTELIEKRSKVYKEIKSCEELYNLHGLINIIKDHIDSYTTDSIIPIDYNSHDVLINIANNKPVVNITKINLAIDDSETFDDLDNMKKQLEDFKKEYETIKEFSIDVIELENKIISIDEITNTKTQEIEELQKNIDILNEKLQIMIDDESNVLNALDLKESLSDITKEYEEKSYRLREIGQCRENINRLTTTIESNEKELDEVNKFIECDTTLRDQLQYKLKEYKNLTEEYTALNLLFKEVDEIKDALNSSTGIPLLYLNVYLKNCPILMNNLLETIFDGELQIDGFVIDENEFRIPFVTKGALVPDIIHASQGESSFISIVLSLSLIIQSMTRYDIISLDELDGPLDTKNREEFIKVLYKFIEQVNCEQVFLITHNNMFDNEPVDIIQTSGVDVENFKYGNIIFNGGK